MRLVQRGGGRLGRRVAVWRVLIAVVAIVAAGTALQMAPAEAIYNGYSTSLGNFPFLVAIKSSKGSNTSLCGGSLIRPEVVLTAAHCVAGASNVSVEFGFGSVEVFAFRYCVPFSGDQIAPSTMPAVVVEISVSV